MRIVLSRQAENFLRKLRKLAEKAEDAYWAREIPKIIKRNKKHGYLSAEETRKRMDDILSS